MSSPHDSLWVPRFGSHDETPPGATMLLETVGPTKSSKAHKKTHRRQRSDQNPLTFEEEQEDKEDKEESEPSTSYFFGEEGLFGRIMSSLRPNRRRRRKRFKSATNPEGEFDDLAPVKGGGLPHIDSNGHLPATEEDAEAPDEPAFITRPVSNNNCNNVNNNNFSASNRAYQRIENPPSGDPNNYVRVL